MSTRRILPVFLAAIAAWLVVSAFLSQWSLLDGAPRNSLALYLDGQAERPFAYRLLMPTLVRSLGKALPEDAQRTLADRFAPHFREQYVRPLLTRHEITLPGISERAERDWRRPDYRRDYVLMVGLIWLAFLGALLAVRQIALTLGGAENLATQLMLGYAAIYPWVFLNGGYFYDFGEQFFACSLVWLALTGRWTTFSALLLLMQCNKETAVLMPFLLAPLLWSRRSPGLAIRLGLLSLACLSILYAIRQHTAHLPGQSGEWNWADNLQFWLTPSNWLMLYQPYGNSLPVPRLAFPVAAFAALLWSCRRGATGAALAATASLALMLGLLLTLGFRDEYRAVGMCLPFLIAGIAAASAPRRD